MATDTVVERQLEDGWHLLSRLEGDGFCVAGACWIKSDDSSRWRLYVASPSVDANGPLAAYRELQRTLSNLPRTRITLSDVTLVGEKHPIAKDVASVPSIDSEDAVRVSMAVFGGMPVEDVYVYPLAFDATDDDEDSLSEHGEKGHPVLSDDEQDASEDPSASLPPPSDEEAETGDAEEPPSGGGGEARRVHEDDE